MERVKVKSSNIKSIGYDEATKTLEVEFSNGGLYQYKEVPKEAYEGFSKAESIGSYFAKNVRAKGFAYLKIENKEVKEGLVSKGGVGEKPIEPPPESPKGQG